MNRSFEVLAVGAVAGARPAALVAAAAICLAALTLALGGRRPNVRRRMAAIARPDSGASGSLGVGAAPGGAGPPGRTGLAGGAVPPGRTGVLGRSSLIRTVAALAGFAIALLLGGIAGVALGVVAAVALDRGLRMLEPGAVRAERVAIAQALPFAADLLAAVLRSGAPTARAVAQVADAVGGPLGDRLGTVARSLALGAPAEEAWQVLAGVPAAVPLVRAAIRANESGAALAGACARLAAEQRAGHDAAADAAARQAGVLVVLPLGCCFLPAFVLLGVVPIVLGVLDDLRL